MRNATGLASCSRALLAIHPQFRLSQLLTLLTIASRSGQTQTEIAVETGLHTQRHQQSGGCPCLHWPA